MILQITLIGVALALIALMALKIFSLRKWINNLASSNDSLREYLEVTDKHKMETEKRFTEAKTLIKHLGYTIHHIGNDLAMNRMEGLVNTSKVNLRKVNGETIVLIGNYFRMYEQGPFQDMFKDKSPLEIAELFNKAIDGTQEVSLSPSN